MLGQPAGAALATALGTHAPRAAIIRSARQIPIAVSAGTQPFVGCVHRSSASPLVTKPSALRTAAPPRRFTSYLAVSAPMTQLLGDGQARAGIGDPDAAAPRASSNAGSASAAHCAAAVNDSNPGLAKVITRTPSTNAVESTFATVRHRTKVTRGPGSRAAGVGMAFKLIQAAQDRWRAVNAPHLVALVRAGATFTNGKLVERPETENGSTTSAEEHTQEAVPAAA